MRQGLGLLPPEGGGAPAIFLRADRKILAGGEPFGGVFQPLFDS